ncbi:calcium/calmodulin-dependent protein kinase [Aspergillus ambiguus]|uniref:putative calcium/calmodulin dependent protein kinase n=1 Tax=Aspergillus ambiguus TaxID=176160 RepID=UPI003CCD2259
MANDDANLPLQDASQLPGDRPGLAHPHPARYASMPSYDSPSRHHRRNPIARRPVKETLNARSEYTTSQDDGTAEHRINQYIIKQEIGRGSFGAVHLAIDQYGNEYAVKEFSKARLRKRAQSHLLRRPRGPKRSSEGFNSPLHRCEDDQKGNALYLIKEEIAIMKKLHHNNLVSLIEVLDDPTEDSLYMVMEMCKKGVVMKVGLEERADPYDDDLCRCWFRDLILGIEYLHAQGIVHRDIKPDNCLVTNDDVLKVVDFGVSEMFEKDSDMFTAKSAGSPAFLPPELCVVKHGDVSGKAADIWSMGVTLYCLRYGKLPFEKQSIFELYEAIKNDPVVCEGEADERFKDLMFRILEKDPKKRIKMAELRTHPWVTKDGSDALLPESENTSDIIEPPTEEEMNSAITTNFGHVLAVMKAVKNFKRLLDPSKADPPMQSILGQEYETHFVEPPQEMEPDESFSPAELSVRNKSHSLNMYNRRARERDYVLKGYHDMAREETTDREEPTGPKPIPSTGNSSRPAPYPERKDSGSIRSQKLREDSIDDSPKPATPHSASPQIPLSRASSATTKRSVEGTRGHARDPLEEEYPFLFIGPSTYTGSHSAEVDAASSTSNADVIYDEPDTLPPSDDPSDLDDTAAAAAAAPIVSESPGAADFDIYETAYRQEIERIRTRSLPRQGALPKVYLTRRVDGKDDVMRLVEENTRSTVPDVGRKIPVPPVNTAPQSTIGGISAQIAQQQSSASDPDSRAAPGTAGSPPESSKARLRYLLGRVRGSRGG